VSAIADVRVPHPTHAVDVAILADVMTVDPTVS
jgi:hypothetical protein